TLYCAPVTSDRWIHLSVRGTEISAIGRW
ncbi:MAG: hypothetical protein RJA51_259, partial [Actinomycetota bacterium]